MPQMLSVAVNGFWVAFMASGALGVISMAAPHSGFAVLSALFAVMVFLGSFPMLALVLATELVPKRIVLPMLVYLWAGVYVSLWPFPDHVVPWISGASNVLQVLLGAFLAWKFRAPGHTWKVPFAAREGRFFRWQYTVIAWFILQAASLWHWWRSFSRPPRSSARRPAGMCACGPTVFIWWSDSSRKATARCDCPA